MGDGLLKWFEGKMNVVVDKITKGEELNVEETWIMLFFVTMDRYDRKFSSLEGKIEYLTKKVGELEEQIGKLEEQIKLMRTESFIKEILESGGMREKSLRAHSS
jgi:cell division protein FtsB